MYKLIANIVYSHPVAVKEIGEIVEAGGSIGPQIGVTGRMGPLKAGFSAQAGVSADINLAGDFSVGFRCSVSGEVNVAGFGNLKGELGFKDQGENIQMIKEVSTSVSEFDKDVDLGLGLEVKAGLVGAGVNINLTEVGDALAKGGKEIYNDIIEIKTTIEYSRIDKYQYQEEEE